VSRPSNANVIPLQIPYRGMSTRYPLAQMPAEFAFWIENLETNQGILESPRGVKKRFDAVTQVVSAIASHPSDPDLIVHLDNTQANPEVNTYNLFTDTAGTKVTSATASTTFNSKAKALGFNKKVFFFMLGDQPQVYNGTTLAAVGFTGPTLTNVVGGFVYKDRLCVFEHLDQSVWYGSLGGVAGAFSEYPLQNITQDNGNVMCGFSVSLSSGLDSQVLFCIVFDTGEVVAYQGSNPASISTWDLVGRFRIAAPLGYQSYIEANGDILVLTKQGIVSIRALFTTAQGNTQAASITREIEDYWLEMITFIESEDSPSSFDPRITKISEINGVYDQNKNKLVIFSPRSLTPVAGDAGRFGFEHNDAAIILIYDFSNQAWTARTISNLPGSSIFSLISAYYHPRSNALLFGSTNITTSEAYELWGNDTYGDDLGGGVTQPIYPELISAPLVIAQNKNINGLQVLHSGAAATKDSVSMKWRENLNEKQTSSTSNAGHTDGVKREIYNVGASEEAAQYEISATVAETATVPYQLANISAILETGGVAG
jgi:hypothetical protein